MSQAKRRTKQIVRSLFRVAGADGFRPRKFDSKYPKTYFTNYLKTFFIWTLKVKIGTIIRESSSLKCLQSFVFVILAQNF